MAKSETWVNGKAECGSGDWVWKGKAMAFHDAHVPSGFYIWYLTQFLE